MITGLSGPVLWWPRVPSGGQCGPSQDACSSFPVWALRAASRSEPCSFRCHAPHSPHTPPTPVLCRPSWGVSQVTAHRHVCFVQEAAGMPRGARGPEAVLSAWGPSPARGWPRACTVTTHTEPAGPRHLLWAGAGPSGAAGVTGTCGSGRRPRQAPQADTRPRLPAPPRPARPVRFLKLKSVS